MARWPWQSKRLRVIARQVHRDEQGRHAMRAGLDRSRATEHHRRVGLIGGGDGGFLAVDDVMVAIALDPQAQVGRIRPAARLGERNGEQSLARVRRVEPGLHHVGPAVIGRGSAR